MFIRRGQDAVLLVGMVMIASVLALPRVVQAQPMVQLTTPYHTINDSFYESFGTGGWGIDRMGPNGGWFFNRGPANSTPPPFGSYDPAADARFGFHLGPFNFNWLGGQGSNRSHVMQAPTIVMPSGGSGMFFDGSMRPFVTGVVPVLGNNPMGMAIPVAPQRSISPLEQRLLRLQQEQAMLDAAAEEQGVGNAMAQAAAMPAAAGEPPLVLNGADPGRAAASSGGTPGVSSSGSTANHGDIGLAEIRAQHAAVDENRHQEIQVRIEKARGYEQAGQAGIAKIYYQQAAARADGDLKRQLLEKIRSLGN